MYHNMAYESGCLTLNIDSFLDISNAQFYENSASSNVGVMKISTKSYVHITDTVFRNNIA